MIFGVSHKGRIHLASQFYPSFVLNVSRNRRYFSAASSSLVQDEVIDLLNPSFVPKDVDLYQYEACPFCNKVKGNLSFAQRIIDGGATSTTMYFATKKLKEKHRIMDERKALYGAA